MATVTRTTRADAPERSRTEHTGGGLLGAVAAEWGKLWTTRTPYVCMAVGVGLTAVFAFYYGSIARINDEPVQAVGKAPIASVILLQFIVVVLAMTTVTSEYATGSIRTSLQWVPVRHRVQLAKAAVTGAVSFVGGVLLGALGMAVAWVPFRGHASFETGEAVAQLLSIGAYLALIAVLSVGVAFVCRSAVGALASLFFLLAGLPFVLLGPGSEVLRKINDALPQSAGDHFMTGDGDPYPSLVGLLIVLSWAVAAHLIGLAVLRRRDA
ncbi:ABC transporter permease [Streptomyces sp. NPDC018584]|uniref:ABC transporter permease n=1 Tax=unclassified Streptomyces TaxID=2593676 RepID=UPI0037933815